MGTTAETEIRALLDEHAAAHAKRDAERIFALYASDAVNYTLAPPLQQGPETPYGTVEGLQAWFATFDGPVNVSHDGAVVVADGDVAYAHVLSNLSATPAGSPEP